MTIAKETVRVREALETIGAPEEARLLMQTALRCSAEALLLRRGEDLSDREHQAVEQTLQERLSGRPLQYIMGSWDFMGLPFEVREGVLIPRADTETLAEQALLLAKERNYTTCLDLCTGSGCLAVSLAALGSLAVTAADVSPAALRIAAENIQKNNVSTLVTLLGSDMFEQIEGRFDLIVSNPPYIPTGDIPTLMREVREHEPVLALDGGADGLKFYRILAEKGKDYLNPGGAMLLEVGIGQAAEVAGLLLENGFLQIEIYRDLSGVERVVRGLRP